jgi:ADP-ribosylglycohydrolase
MNPDTILILEDNDERITAFTDAVPILMPGCQLRVWRDAPSFIAEAEEWFPRAALISLDHDLNPQPGGSADPGTGLEVARFLADYLPVCPVIVHSSNTDRAWSMHNELRFAGWQPERIGPMDNHSRIGSFWLRKAAEMLASTSNTHLQRRPLDHTARIDQVQLSLAGVGLGDAIGEMCAYQAHRAPGRLQNGELSSGPWFHTDDTEMAISVSDVLRIHGFIEPDALARRFARRFERDPERGYGKMTRIQLREVLAGAPWREMSANAFGGQGSKGNGAAMRATPVGAYFQNDLDAVVGNARLSAVVTHTHPEGIAGAIAVAVAAALVDRLRGGSANEVGEFWSGVLDHTPESQVRRALYLAAQTPVDISPEDTAKALGNGSLVTAPDTVPFALWCAARHAHDFRRAIAAAIQTGGDCDTNAAIVGGIVALSVGRAGLPSEWLAAREPIPFWQFSP